VKELTFETSAALSAAKGRNPMAAIHTSDYDVRYRTANVDGVKIFYREAGDSKAPALLLLHGFPTSSHMFRDLIPLLSDRYHVVAPDLPGFGFSDSPDRSQFSTRSRISRR
jgi:pimeloyl-ACP methyl ester carboxylesterase